MKRTRFPLHFVPLIVGLLSALFTRGAGAQPADNVRSTIEQLMVRVRTVDVETSQEIEVGCGLVVGFDAKDLTILTARHVVKAAEKADAKIAVKFPGEAIWRDCALGPKLNDDVDAAFLRISREGLGYEGDPPCANLTAAATPSRGSRVYAAGFDLDVEQGKLMWRAGVFESTKAGVAGFDADGVKGGYSGGVVVSDVGIIGMTVKAGPDGRSHEAHALPELLELIRAKGGAVRMNDPSSGAALAANALLKRGSLTAALEVRCRDREGRRSFGFWAALQPRPSDGELVESFDAITVSARQPVRIRMLGPAIELELPADLHAVGGGRKAMLPQGTYRFAPDGAAAVPGFMIWKSGTEAATVYLALPTASNELLAARALAEASTGGNPPKLDSDMAKALIFENPPHLDSSARPFSIKLDEDLWIRFRTPLASHRDRPVRFEGEFFIPDEFGAIRVSKMEAQIASWQTRSYEVVKDESSEQLAKVDGFWGKRTFVLAPNRPSSDFMRIKLTPPARGPNSSNLFMFVAGLRIVYEQAP